MFAKISLTGCFSLPDSKTIPIKQLLQTGAYFLVQKGEGDGTQPAVQPMQRSHPWRAAANVLHEPGAKPKQHQAAVALLCIHLEPSITIFSPCTKFFCMQGTGDGLQPAVPSTQQTCPWRAAAEGLQLCRACCSLSNNICVIMQHSLPLHKHSAF